ncbi:thiamine pyrophosphate-dependent enzyme [Paratractidigestivibacter sp.]|uniref:thiamine pyrophosphate-dependent enzyme n=1 Tax=Paratractidigestivibacter sp. TaxID=2847316 RepID=UPI002AC9386C|nr:thiamine pyrophosphate-dependent enzyme [Paratractidigestivibacter sp.]
MTKQLVMGNQAFAYAALQAGVRVVAGYPGTPSTELVETVAKLKKQGVAHGVHVEWSTNEKAALEVLAGASYAGARCLFTCKQVGLNVASDPLMSLNYVGIKGGLVLFVTDDPGPISSQTEQDTRRFAAFAKIPVLDPENLEQGYAMMQEAFEISERYHTPVIVRPTTRVCHASTYIDVPESTEARPAGTFEKDPKWVIFPRRSFQAHGEVNERLPRIADEFSDGERGGTFNPIEDHGENPRLGIMAGGVSAAYAREALAIIERRAKAAGAKVPAYRFMQVGLPYPFPKAAAERFADGLEQVVIAEELDFVLEDEMLRLAGRTHAAWAVRGKLDDTMPGRGENTVDDLVVRLAKFLGVDEKAMAAAGTDRPEPPALPVRPPVLCPGCPHRGSFYAVKQALKKLGCTDAVLSGDIGCYTLGNAAPLDAVDTCLCMGAGITMAQGLGIAEPERKQIAFVGDSTFFASAMTGIANAVYNGHDITVFVLDNAITAMTGGQPHPGTGLRLSGERSQPISIEAVLRALGVTCIEHAHSFDLGETVEAASRAIAHEGPSAVICEGLCVSLSKPKPALHVDNDLCRGCKRCITQIGCPAIGWDAEGRRAFVNPALCNGCGLCTQVCGFGAIVRPDDAASGDGAATAAPTEATKGGEASC